MVVVSFQTSQEQASLLKERARCEDRSVSAVLRRIVDEALKVNPPRPSEVQVARPGECKGLVNPGE